MHLRDLRIGLVCYWQDHGFHGTVVIRKFNKRYIHYSHISKNKIEEKTTYKALSKFLNDFQIYECEYGGFHKNIGKVLDMSGFDNE